MSSVLQLLASGLATGAIYALVAVGFSLLWQTSQTINFAQGEFVMVPAFFVLMAMNMGMPFPLAALFGILASALVLGLLFKRIIVDPMLRHGVLPLVVATIALSLFMREAVKDFYSSQAQPFPSIVADADITIMRHGVLRPEPCGPGGGGLRGRGAAHVPHAHPARAHDAGDRAEPLGRAHPGHSGRADDPADFLINSVLCAVASILISPIYLAKFTNGETLGLAAFVAAIIGGFNQARGAMLGGILLGVLDNLCAAYLSAQYRSAVPLLLLVVVILFRPQGLLGRAEERTV